MQLASVQYSPADGSYSFCDLPAKSKVFVDRAAMTTSAMARNGETTSAAGVRSIEPEDSVGVQSFPTGAAPSFQVGLNHELPQIEIRFQNLSLTTKIKVPTDTKGATHELPTIANQFQRKPKTEITKYIFHDVSGVFRPGTMTLVLGQPGSGKSALLQYLSGRFPPSKNVTVEGNVTYNGVSRSELVEHRRLPQFVSYVPQRDQHYPTMTVKETFDFAHHCCGSGLAAVDEEHFQHAKDADHKHAAGAVQSLYGHYTEHVTQQLGLDHCKDTIAGDMMLRGVSGGERKRVTMGEMEFGNRFVALMDEISTGLDSAATFDIVKTQRNLAKTLRKTVVMALLQPAPEVFDLFDDVMILNQGHVLYHGPCNQVVGYFTALGLECPVDRDVADFLIDIGTLKQAEYEEVDSAHTIKARTPVELALRFHESSIFRTTLRVLEELTGEETRSDFMQRVISTPEFNQPFWDSTFTLLKRELHVTWRNKPLMAGRAILLLAVVFLDATLYFDLDLQNTQFTLGTIFGVFLYFVLNQPAMVALFIKNRDIFYKQRDANFFRTSSYVTAVATTQVLLAIPDALIFSTVLYWTFGLVSDFSLYLTFTTVMLLISLAFTSLTFFISSVSPSLAIGGSITTLYVLIFTLFGGLFITHKHIPAYFVWAYWLNPMAWSLRSIGVAQYSHESFDKCAYDGIDYCALSQKKMGVYSLDLFDIYTDRVWLWAGMVFLMATFVVSYAGGSYMLEYVRYQPESIDGKVTGSLIEGSSDRTEINEADEIFNTAANESPQSHHIAVITPRSHQRVAPITLAFKDLRYTVANPASKGGNIELLKGVSGFAKPGTITALMGSSGAGKTTLMDVIAGRTTGGKIEGQVMLNGYITDDISIRRSTGYCEQMSETHCEAATFREALTFSAFLRQGDDASAADKYDTVEECLDLLNLRTIGDKVIRGSSLEQLKRLSIGVELAAKQSVLFLDEPTSGLDARAAKVVMDAVRKVADSGRTVVCTIHQPSWEVFQLFDSVLLLQRGGYMVYFGEIGPDARDMVGYFSSMEGVEACAKGYNPATWMLEVIGAGTTSSNAKSAEIDFVAAFEASTNKTTLNWYLTQEGVASPTPGLGPLDFTKKRAASNAVQFAWLLERFAQTYWRSAEHNVARIAVGVVLGLVNGLAFGSTDFDTYQGVNTTATMVGLSSVFLGVVAFDSAIPFAFTDRAAYYRERASQTYNSLWYWVGSTLIEIPYVFTMGFGFSAVFFPLAGFFGVLRFLAYWVHLSLHLLLQTFIGQAIAFATPSVELATTFGLLVTSTSFLFMGFNPPSALIPSGYKWLNSSVAPKYTMAIFGDCSNASDLGCHQLKDAPPTFPTNITSAEYLDRVFLIRYGDLWFNFGVIIVYIAVVRVLGLLALRFVRRESR